MFSVHHQEGAVKAKMTSNSYYIYDESEIIRSCHALRQSLEEFDFLYSIKANPFLPVLEVIAGQGFGADAASLQEVDQSLEAGIRAEDIYYSAPGKTESDIAESIGKCILIADSLHELEMIQAVATQRDIHLSAGFRIHPDFGIGRAKAGPSKFGIDIEQIDALKSVLQKCPNISPVGIHVHLKSQILNADVIADYYRNVMNLALRLKDELHMEMQFINFGSGIGIAYDPDKQEPVDLLLLHDAVKEVRCMKRDLGARLLIETGRYVMCHAGKYILPVIDKKISHGETYLIVPNGLNGFLRPAFALMLENAAGIDLPVMEPLYTCRNEVQLRVLNETKEQETVTVAGNLCTALDVIAESVTMNRAEIGDLIEVSNAGSYAYSLSPLGFGGHEPPAQYLRLGDGSIVK